ncbi:MAG: hypothetical protein XD36_2464 [Halomonas sp. 54_146]|nr:MULTISPECIES: hypothetical protein [unclassified Halomonas]KUJ87103.1 MAG: hypothetical protein XD36_2464 [Halomonas sp. 54_146]HAA45213.1 hypothetical protein [Halomonas sp.]
MKDKQQGAALVIVMALLSGALMIGISGMNSALIDERLAGNYRAVALAQMNAERAVSQAIQEFYEGQRASELSWTKPPLTSMDEVGDIFDDTENDPSWCEGSNNRCAYEFLVIDGVYSIVAKGRVVEESTGQVISESSFIRINFDDSNGGGGGGEEDEELTDKDVADLLNKIITSGDLLNVMDEDYGFSSSKNDKGESWEENVSVDSSLFENPEIACLFKNSLLSGSIANGLVEELIANVGKEDLSNASGKIAVVTEDGFSLPNNSDFTGVLMIFGKDFRITGGANVNFNGAIVHVPVDCANGNFYTPQIDIRGGNGNYNLSAIESIINQLDIDDEDDDSDGNGGVVSSNEDLQVGGWEWSFD